MKPGEMDLDTPFYSIIIPVYKVEKYILKCVKSVIRQSFTDFEIILVDDGSPDNCPMICDRIAKKDERVRTFHKTNGGLSDARNYGLKKSKGKYILFIDSDDYLRNNSVLSCAYEMLQKKQVDMLLFGISKFYEKNHKYVAGNQFKNAPITYGYIDDVISHGLYNMSACTKIISRSLLVKHNISFRKGVFSEDMEWSVRLAGCADGICVLKADDYVYRQRGDSISHSISKKNLDDVGCNIKKCVKIIGENPDVNKRRALYTFFSQFISMYMICLSSVKNEMRKTYVPYLSSFIRFLACGNRFRERVLYRICNLFGVSFTLKLLRIALLAKKILT